MKKVQHVPIDKRVTSSFTGRFPKVVTVFFTSFGKGSDPTPEIRTIKNFQKISSRGCHGSYQQTNQMHGWLNLGSQDLLRYRVLDHKKIVY
jgi:hypothetical protein